jgi:hypothetical protein
VFDTHSYVLDALSQVLFFLSLFHGSHFLKVLLVAFVLWVVSCNVNKRKIEHRGIWAVGTAQEPCQRWQQSPATTEDSFSSRQTPHSSLAVVFSPLDRVLAPYRRRLWPLRPPPPRAAASPPPVTSPRFPSPVSWQKDRPPPPHLVDLERADLELTDQDSIRCGHPPAFHL